jgi:hypothetical protein
MAETRNDGVDVYMYHEAERGHCERSETTKSHDSCNLIEQQKATEETREVMPTAQGQNSVRSEMLDAYGPISTDIPHMCSTTSRIFSLMRLGIMGSRAAFRLHTDPQFLQLLLPRYKTLLLRLYLSRWRARNLDRRVDKGGCSAAVIECMHVAYGA